MHDLCAADIHFPKDDRISVKINRNQNVRDKEEREGSPVDWSIDD